MLHRRRSVENSAEKRLHAGRICMSAPLKFEPPGAVRLYARVMGF